jgi:polar amino acid transport system ATP-binding protein
MSLANTQPVLRVTGLRKVYGDNVVLDDLDLTANEHSCIALIGASGSGKSTLLRCIDLLEVVDDGVVELDGEDITDPRVDGDKIRTRIGIVFQAFNLFPHLRVIDNVTLAPRRVHKLSRDQAEAEAIALLDRVGLRDKAHARPDELSGGQQQRVAIARGLVSRPTVMFADEPTGNLDSTTSEEILNLLRETVETYGQTTVMVTHDARASAMADRILFLADGLIVRDQPRASAQDVLAAMAEVSGR